MPDHSRRLAALHTYDLIGTLPEKTFDDITKIAAISLNAPIAILSFVDEDHEWMKSRLGTKERTVLRKFSFANKIIGSSLELIEISEQSSPELFQHNKLLRQEGIRFGIGAPIITDDNLRIGAVYVLYRDYPDVSVCQKESLSALARQVIIQLNIRRQNKKLLFESHLVEKSVLGMACADQDGKIVFFNSTYSELMGIAKDVLSSQHVYEFDTGIDEEGWLLHWEDMKTCKRKTIRTVTVGTSGKRTRVQIDLKYITIGEEDFISAACHEVKSATEIDHWA